MNHEELLRGLASPPRGFSHNAGQQKLPRLRSSRGLRKTGPAQTALLAGRTTPTDAATDPKRYAGIYVRYSVVVPL